ncbi:MAG: S-layer homology domain-containing protein [Clostridia bacterium]|nr:S-layer homology domain-containing protein [Clostridia bacterium]
MSKQTNNKKKQTGASSHGLAVRIMVWVLAIAMIVTTVAAALVGVFAGSAQAAEASNVFPDVAAGTALEKAAKALKEKNILDGYTDGTFKPEGDITRAEFAKIIACFKNVGSFIEKDAVTGFADVDDTNHWARGYVKAAKNLSIIDGFPDGLFYPDNKVTYEQAIKMVVCALGYTGLAYPDGYISFAMTNKLLMNSTHTKGYSDATSRGAVAVLVYNALSVKLSTSVSASIGGGGGGGKINSSSTANDSFKDGQTVKGIVSATYTTSLTAATTMLGEREITLDLTDGTQKTLVVADSYSRLDDYLGFQVQAVIDKDDNGDEYFKTLKKTNKNITLSIGASDFNSFEKVENGRSVIWYWNTSGRSSKAQLSEKGVTMLYNGNWAAYNDQYLSKFESGNIDLISNDGDGYYDIAKITSYTTGVVTYVAKTGGEVSKITFGFGVPALSVPKFSESGASCKVVKNGSSASLKSLAINDVVSYAISADESVYDFRISNAKNLKSVKLVSYNDGALRFSGITAKYKMTKSFKEYVENTEDFELTTGAHYNVFCDYNGEVAGMEEVEEKQTLYYAYVLKATTTQESSSKEEVAQMMVFSLGTTENKTVYEGAAKGKTKQVSINSTVLIDGVQFKKNPDGVVEALKKAAKVVNEGKARGRNAETAQLIRYKVNSTGQVTEIDTILDQNGALSTAAGDTYNQMYMGAACRDADGTSTRFVYQGSGKFTRASDGAVIKMNSSTRVLFVPENRTGSSDEYVGKMYAAANYQTGFSYYFESYNVISSTGYARIVLQYYAAATEEFNYMSDTGIVRAVEQTINSDDEVIVKISFFDMLKLSNRTVTTKTIEQTNVAMNLNVGDVFRYTTTGSGDLAKIKRVVDIENLPVLRVNSIGDAQEQRVILSTDGLDEEWSDSEDSKFRLTYNTLYSYDIASSNNGGTMGLSRALITDINYRDYIAQQVETYTVYSSTKVVEYNADDYDDPKVIVGSVTSYFPAKNDDRLMSGIPHFYVDMVEREVPEETNQAIVLTKDGVVKCVYYICNSKQLDTVNKNYKNYTILNSEIDKTQLAVGETAQLTSYVTYGDETKHYVTPEYTVTPEGAVTIDETGLVTAVKGGKIEIRATHTISGKEYTDTVDLVIRKEITSLTAEAETLSLIDENSTTITLTAGYNDGSFDVVTATDYLIDGKDTSSVISYANNKVTAIGAGEATLTLKYEGMEASLTFTVIEKIIVDVKIRMEKTELVVGQSVAYTVEAVYNDESTVVVNPGEKSTEQKAIIYLEDGAVYANKPGTETFKVVYSRKGQQFTDSVEITVIERQQVSLVLEADKTEDLYTEDEITFKVYAVYNDDFREEVTPEIVSSDIDAALALVEGVKYRLQKEGTITITATYGDLSGTMVLEVVKKEIESITATATATELIEGQTADITVMAVYNNGSSEDVTEAAAFVSGNDHMTVSANTVTAVKAGLTTVEITYGEFSADILFVIMAREITGIEVLPSDATVLIGEEFEITASYVYNDGSKEDASAEASFAVAIPEYVTMEGNKALAVAVGTTAITVTLGDETKEIVITVIDESAVPALLVSATFVQEDASRFAEVVLFVKNNPGIASFGFDLTYDDTVLDPVSVQKMDYTGGVTEPDYTVRPLRILGISPMDYTEDGALVKVRFEVSAQVTDETMVDFSVSYTDGDVCNQEKESVTLKMDAAAIQMTIPVAE